MTTVGKEVSGKTLRDHDSCAYSLWEEHNGGPTHLVWEWETEFAILRNVCLGIAN